jgi:hypothetical protein
MKSTTNKLKISKKSTINKFKEFKSAPKKLRKNQIATNMFKGA